MKKITLLKQKNTAEKVWTMVPAKHLIISLFVTTFIIQLANMSVQPIVTLYVKNLVGPHTAHIETIAGAVMSATGLAVILAKTKTRKIIRSYRSSKTLVVALFVCRNYFYPASICNLSLATINSSIFIRYRTSRIITFCTNSTKTTYTNPCYGTDIWI